MKTVYKFTYLILPLYIGCGMGVQSEDLDTVSTSNTATSETTAIKNEENDSATNALENASKPSNAIPTSTSVETESNSVTSKQNDIKTFTEEKIKERSTAFSKDKPLANSDTNETVPAPVSKMNEKVGKVASINELKSKLNDNTTIKNTIADNKKQIDVKSFTKEKIRAMQRTFSKDKPLANSDTKENTPAAVTKTDRNTAEILVIKELKSKLNKNATAKNAVSENKKQNDVKSFTKEEILAMQRTFSKDKPLTNSDTKETTPAAVTKTDGNTAEILVIKELKSKLNNNITPKNEIANNKKQNDVKSFTKEEILAMQRTLSKDKPLANSDTKETTPEAVTKTDRNTAEVAAKDELKSKLNDNSITKNAIADNKKQNDVKSFTKEEIRAMQRTLSKDKPLANSDTKETTPVAEVKTNGKTDKVEAANELKSKLNNNIAPKNEIANNKKQNDVKSFTKEEIQAMQRTFSKDKPIANSETKETTPEAVAKTDGKAVAVVKETNLKQNDKKLVIKSIPNTATSSITKETAANASKPNLLKQNVVKNNSNAVEKSTSKHNTKSTTVAEKGNTTNLKIADKQKVVAASSAKLDMVKGTPEANKKSGTSNENIKISTASIVETKEKKQNASGIEQIKIRVLNLKESYSTNKSHTLIIEIENGENSTSNLKLTAELPRNWSLISISDIGVMEANQKKMVLISFNIPVDNASGDVGATFTVKNLNGNKIGSKEVVFNIEPNLDVEVYNIYTSDKVQAGEMITAKYEIKNRGNVEQEISLSSINTIKGGKLIKLGPNMTATVEITQKTDAKYYDFTTIGTSITAISVTSGKSYKAYGSTKVFPTKLKQADPFFRYPVRFSVNYNSNTFQDKHYSTISGEFIGDGFLDLKRKNYLNLIIRAPQQKNLKNFGVTDQYSLIYKYNNSTTVYLGDHAHYINRLGFDSRFGLGFRVDQNINNWTLSAFFTKPRLYSFNSEALFGFKSVYRFNKTALLGFAVESSKGTVMGANKNIEANLDEKGQIGTANFELRAKNTFINAESSLSVTNKHVDQAHFFNLVQKMNGLTYSGSFTFSGENYFGIIRNSIEYSNSLFYKFRKFDFVVGQTLSEVNKRLDPLFYAAEPYFENYYGKIGYRFGQKSYINIRVDRRIREDQLEPKSYFYRESGIDYRYIFSGRAFTFGFTGRIAETQNLLSNDLQYRKTYSHNIDASYRFSDHFSLRSGINHNYSNRYNDTNANENYYTYSVGIDYNFSRNFRFNTTYNSGFSPEDTYLRRDFINAMLMVTLAKNHLFEIRVNYFENPGITNKKELLAFGTYTYSFGVPLKRILEQGGVNGLIQVNDKSIDVKGIKIIAAGKSIVTNAKGIFELNNLPLGKNYILMDESTLPFGIIPALKTPFQVTVEKDKKAELNITIVRASTILGTLVFPEFTRPNGNNLEGYLKIENENFTYNVESNAQGVFKFQNIVPGTYKLTLTRYKGKEFFEIEKETQITVKEGEKTTLNVPVKGKERKVQFKSKNFTIGS